MSCLLGFFQIWCSVAGCHQICASVETLSLPTFTSLEAQPTDSRHILPSVTVYPSFLSFIFEAKGPFSCGNGRPGSLPIGVPRDNGIRSLVCWSARDHFTTRQQHLSPSISCVERSLFFLRGCVHLFDLQPSVAKPPSQYVGLVWRGSRPSQKRCPEECHLEAAAAVGHVA